MRTRLLGFVTVLLFGLVGCSLFYESRRVLRIGVGISDKTTPESIKVSDDPAVVRKGAQVEWYVTQGTLSLTFADSTANSARVCGAATHRDRAAVCTLDTSRLTPGVYQYTVTIARPGRSNLVLDPDLDIRW